MQYDTAKPAIPARFYVASRYPTLVSNPESLKLLDSVFGKIESTLDVRTTAALKTAEKTTTTAPTAPTILSPILVPNLRAEVDPFVPFDAPQTLKESACVPASLRKTGTKITLTEDGIYKLFLDIFQKDYTNLLSDCGYPNRLFAFGDEEKAVLSYESLKTNDPTYPTFGEYLRKKSIQKKQVMGALNDLNYVFVRRNAEGMLDSAVKKAWLIRGNWKDNNFFTFALHPEHELNKR